MNLIIFGESRCGKTTLANLICCSSVGYSKISCDYLIMALKNALPEAGIDFSNKEKFSKFLEAYLGALFNKEDACAISYVVEGGSLTYDLILKLKELSNTKVICVGKPDLTPEDFFDEIRKYEYGLKTGGWTKRLNDETLMSWCTDWIKKSKKHKEFCEKNNIFYVNTSFNMIEKLYEVLGWLNKK